MKKFNYLNKCSKCGLEGALTKYITDSTDYYGQMNDEGLLQRTCRQCAFVWYEYPLDASGILKCVTHLKKEVKK